MNNNSLNTKNLTVQIDGSSKDGLRDAVNVAFSRLQSVVNKELNNEIMLYMKPVSVNVISKDEEEYTERFLFIFFPRKKIKTAISLSVTVEVATLAI